jgi:hypothetical protein
VLSRSHGTYSISLDGGAKQYYNGYSYNIRMQQVLYQIEGLTYGEHGLVLVNEGDYNNGGTHV